MLRSEAFKQLDSAAVRLVNMQRDLSGGSMAYDARTVIAEVLQVARDRNQSKRIAMSVGFDGPVSEVA